jgi:hypothetical protein
MALRHEFLSNKVKRLVVAGKQGNLRACLPKTRGHCFAQPTVRSCDDNALPFKIQKVG